jgi:hypothetical protein
VLKIFLIQKLVTKNLITNTNTNNKPDNFGELDHYTRAGFNTVRVEIKYEYYKQLAKKLSRFD